MINNFTKILKLLILTIVVIISSDNILAQSYNSTSKKAAKHFEKAKQEFLNKNYENAISNANKALNHDDYYTDAYLLKAEAYLELNLDSLAIIAYEHIFDIDSMTSPKIAIPLSKLYIKHFQFDKSIYLLNWFLSLSNQKEKLREIATRQLALAKFRKSLVNNPVKYNPHNIGDVINTSSDEYVNQFYVNENKLIYTKRYKTETKSYLEEKVFVSEMYDSIWTNPKLLFDDFEDIGAANISSDGNEVYFSASNWDGGSGSCDIYYLEYKEDKWSAPKNIKSINTSEWESQPCISYDGSELYFVRRNKKYGTSDIYVSSRDADGHWMKAEKLNSIINTDGNEMAPFIHHDGKTLYFSSDMHLGMGGYDLFVSRRDENNDWSEPVNLGFPLNTDGDEINIVVSNDAKKAYMSAVRNGGHGGYDIYEFDLDEDFRPEALEIERPSDEIFYADALNKYGTVVLKEIHFEFGSAELNYESEEGIKAVFNFLISNPDKVILLEGHTDDMGKEDYNTLLSEKRAESVKTALINRGISSDRIKTKGHGSSDFLVPNDSEENRALNRRVEMSLIKE